MAGIRVGEAKNPGPRLIRRRKFVSPDEGAVGGAVARDTDIDDAPLVSPEVSVDVVEALEHDLAATQWEASASFSLRSMGLEFVSGTLGTPVSLSNRFTVLDECSGPDIHQMSEGSHDSASTSIDTESVVCEPRVQRRRFSLVWDAESHPHPAYQREPGPDRSRSPMEQSGARSESDTDSVMWFGDEDCAGSIVSGDEEPGELLVTAEVLPMCPSVANQRRGFAQLDEVDLPDLFTCRASVMQTVPRFLWGSFRAALKVALEEILEGYQSRSVVRQERGWKLFLLLPRMLLHRSRRGGFLSRDKLVARFDKFAAGQWNSLV